MLTYTHVKYCNRDTAQHIAYLADRAASVCNFVSRADKAHDASSCGQPH
jgi:hypothetical protein